MSKNTFHNKVIWITGGGSGLGRAMAHEFAAQGAKIIVSGRRKDRLETVVEEIHALGGTGLALPCDVTNDEALAEAMNTLMARFKRLDVCIANAGFGVSGRVENLTAADWRKQFDVNVVGAAATAATALPALRRSHGRMVLVGSVAGFVCAPGVAPYHASKHAVRALGQTLAMELHGTGVSVTTLHPGFVESEIGQVDNEGTYHAERKDPRPQLFMWRTNDAARVMVSAIKKRKREYVFTRHGKLAVALGRFTPDLVHVIVTRSKTLYKRR